MYDTYRIYCLKCAAKTHKKIEQIPSAYNETVLNVISYVCSRCGHVNLHTDMFFSERCEKGH